MYLATFVSIASIDVCEAVVLVMYVIAPRQAMQLLKAEPLTSLCVCFHQQHFKGFKESKSYI